MSHYLKNLLSQSQSLIPQLASIYSKIPQQKLYIHYPIQIQRQAQFPSTFYGGSIFLRSQKLIRSNNHLIMCQAGWIFSSAGFAGASSNQEDQLNKKLADLKTKYQIFDQDMISRVKLTLTIKANHIDNSMPLHQYARTVLKYKRVSTLDNYIKNYTNSGFLKSILHSNKIAVSTAYEFLQQKFLKQIKLDDFGSAYQIVRNFSKQQKKVRLIFPFCNNIKHSFDPNCEIRIIFLTHRRESFLTLHSIKQILPGQQLTINYGNQNNYELFVRYGFTQKNNKFSEFYLPLDFSEIDNIFNSNIQWKMSMFKKNKQFKLKNFIRIDINGKIHPQDMKVLKIVFSTKPLSRQQFIQQSEDSKQLQAQIYKFVRSTGLKFKTAHDQSKKQRAQQTKQQIKSIQNFESDPIMINIRRIQSEQNEILTRLVQSK